jgi:predicted site-specific integrase-resolvase
MAVPFRERLTCSIEDAEQATGISRAELYRMIDAGKIRTRKEGRRLIIVRSLVERFDPDAPTAATAPPAEG